MMVFRACYTLFIINDNLAILKRMEDPGDVLLNNLGITLKSKFNAPNLYESLFPTLKIF